MARMSREDRVQLRSDARAARDTIRAERSNARTARRDERAAEREARKAVKYDEIIQKKYGDTAVWVPVSERLPTDEDADPDGNVWLGAALEEPRLVNFNDVAAFVSAEDHFWARFDAYSPDEDEDDEDGSAT